MLVMQKYKQLLLNNNALKNKLKEFPLEPGVYLMLDKQEDILYIGKSKRLRVRVRSYFQEGQYHTPRINLMLQQVNNIEFIVTDNEAEALALEANLIKQYQPYFNVLLKDDKKYPYVCITWSEEYPRIFITRKRRLDNKKDRYYGPYVDTHKLRETLRLVRRVFPLRQRKRPLFKDRPCLNYDIGRCPGVCQKLITSNQYHKIVAKIAMIFQGRTEELVQRLDTQMKLYSTQLKFEQAAQIRDRIEALQELNINQKVVLPNDTVSRDVIALASDNSCTCIQLFQIRGGRLIGRLGFFADNISGTLGSILQRVLEEHYWQVEPIEIPNEVVVQYELPKVDVFTDWLKNKKGKKVTVTVPKKQQKIEIINLVQRNAAYELEKTQKDMEQNLSSLQDLTTILNLKNIPYRIEGYDISHIQGSNAVASQVVFINGIPAQQSYRHYKIKNTAIGIGHSDDFACLAEVIGRRFNSYRNLKIEDLLKLDDYPNLVLIDGGKGQLSAVVKILKEMKLFPLLEVISLAKKNEEIFVPGNSNALITNSEQPGLKLLRKVRDEAHRFAINYHRQQRLKYSRSSQLDDIPGLGFQRQKELLSFFHSVDYIREASVESLRKAPGIGYSLAREIYEYFHPDKIS
ncbi:Excinuclease ABC subunit C [Candidatus Atelocyanobacterium thalassa isolate ALOHA]|uniref:UvrABC system protein C n=2 Tax=Candidatus Atelocyanobacterium thalassae TaxID=713887 RepID=D3EMT5_ATETH|nr:Excinuclease ABC subunit C [Candidatus Atelocyanobacterium thalassa isolate ALOHA]|tara:strand:- start:467 stop:2356 length:1890 start_codon:yes stop_codon:yes gene_type:complete